MLSLGIFTVFGALALTQAGDDETMAMVDEICWRMHIYLHINYVFASFCCCCYVVIDVGVVVIFFP